MASLNALIQSAYQDKRRLTKIRDRLINKFKSNPTVTAGLLARLKSELDDFSSIRSSYEETAALILSRIDEVTDDAKRNKLESEVIDESDLIRAAYTELLEKLENLRVKYEGKSKDGASASSTQPSLAGIKLQDIDVPEFHGSFREFMSFKGIFESLVHNNPKYSNSEKMYYLSMALKGEAKKVLSGTNSVATVISYPEAWSLVCEWYENSVAVTNQLFADLFSIKKIPHPSGIRSLILDTDSIIRGLKSVNLKPDDWGSILYYLTMMKLDDETKRDWHNSRSSCAEYPTYQDLKVFLLGRAHVLDYTGPSQKMKTPSVNMPPSEKTPSKKVFAVSSRYSCVCCKKSSHLLIECEQFNSLDPKERYDVIREASLCVNCFNSKHKARDCPKMPCKLCKKRHNSLLHFADTNTTSTVPLTADNKSESVPRVVDTNVEVKTIAAIQKGKKFILLPTAVVQFNCGNIFGLMRIMFDCCSQSTAVVDTFVAKNRLKTCASNTRLSGVGGRINSNSKCELTLHSRVSRFQLDIEADVVPHSAITYEIPADATYLNVAELSRYPLAEKPLKYRSVDLILGNEYYNQCVLGATRVFDGVIFQETEFGWTPTGPVRRQASCNTLFSFSTVADIKEDLSKFWALEEVLPIKPLESEYEECKRHFRETVERSTDGRFIVQLPLKSSPDLLGESRSSALKSLLYSEKRQNVRVREQYAEFMNEYAVLGHMSLVADNSDASNYPKYFIKHHAVLRPTSSTTKLRVVFNASAPTFNGPSLNDILMVGPKVQPDLFDILISFRMFIVAWAADIEKMYRQVLVHPKDRKLQHILWRREVNDPVKEFELNTLTYGTAPASFIATECLSVLADNVESDPFATSVEFNKEIAEAIREHFYMDDFLYSAPTVEAAIKLQKAVHSTLLEGQFPLRKYVSNNLEFIKNLDPYLTEEKVLDLTTETSTQVLGLIWHPSDDSFRIKVNIEQLNAESLITKRVVLAFSARIFDPLGFLSPVTIRFKILLQRIWQEKIDWDDQVSSENKAIFEECVNDLTKLADFKIQRPYSRLDIHHRRLIGFCDASTSAYCAVVYLETVSPDGQSDTYLVCSKTKVAPLSRDKVIEDVQNPERINIHRLELTAALLLANLLLRVSDRTKITEMQAYSDSQVALCWMAKSPTDWKPFVQNRVAKIKELIPQTRWLYINTLLNPADLATRGIKAEKLLTNPMWLKGPVLSERNCEPELSSHLLTVVEDERKIENSTMNNTVISEGSMFDSSSSFRRLQYAIARILRLAHVCRAKRQNGTGQNSEPVQVVENPSSQELKRAFIALVRYAQKLSFPEEVRKLTAKSPINPKDQLWSWDPMLDDEGVLRVTGRLQNASVSAEQRHPVIMDAKSRFSLLYARHIHETYFHAGSKFIIAFLCHRFRFVGSVSVLAKGIVHKCVVCARFNRRPLNQRMAPLPLERVTISLPFAAVVIDFAGPFDTKCVGHRSNVRFKSYLCVFVCLTIRAAHLEVVSGLETSHFLDAYNRFIARRGSPAKIFSDNGSTFVKASKCINVDWQFGPPFGPHHQGLAEAAVKSAKRCLLKVTKGCTLSFEELTTLFTRIEAVMNSRPLCAYRDGYLTPGHFLTGDHLLSAAKLEDDVVGLSQRFHLVNKMFQDFWRSWSSEYLNIINNRTKWLKPSQNLVPGDLVLVFQPDTKPTFWPLAVVTKTYPAPDGLVRRVLVRMHGREYERPITRLVLLPVEDSLRNPPGDC